MSVTVKMFFARQTFFLIFFASGIIAQSNEENNEEDISSEFFENENNLITTYKTPVESFLQTLMNAFENISKKYSSNDGNEIVKFVHQILPKSVEEAFEPMRKDTIKGFGDFLNRFKDRFHALYPGTVWCGQGNAAKGENDVGFFSGTDSCCRAHDKCPHYILAGGTLGVLYNDGCFPRFGCSCDLEFYNCLKNDNNPISRSIGTTYFNLLRPQCFGPENSNERCSREASDKLVEGKCIKYDSDSTKNKTFKWFDNPTFE